MTNIRVVYIRCDGPAANGDCPKEAQVEEGKRPMFWVTFHGAKNTDYHLCATCQDACGISDWVKVINDRGWS